MNTKTTLVVAFSKTLPEANRGKVLQDILKVEGVDTVTPGDVAIVEMNELRSGARVQREISELEGVEEVISPPMSQYFASDLPQQVPGGLKR